MSNAYEKPHTVAVLSVGVVSLLIGLLLLPKYPQWQSDGTGNLAKKTLADNGYTGVEIEKAWKFPFGLDAICEGDDPTRFKLTGMKNGKKTTDMGKCAWRAMAR